MFKIGVKFLKGFDILVNSAGVGIIKSIEEITSREWKNLIETNLTGTFNCCKVGLPYLK